MFGSFFEQDHLLNLIILIVYAKRWPTFARISKQPLTWLKVWSMIFFLTLTVRGTFHRKDFLWKKGDMGLISEKMEALYAELNKTAEATTSGYFVTDDFLQYIYSVLVAKNHHKIRSKCLVHEFSSTGIF